MNDKVACQVGGGDPPVGASVIIFSGTSRQAYHVSLAFKAVYAGLLDTSVGPAELKSE